MNRERSQVWIFTIMIVVLILMLFCPVVFGQVSLPSPIRPSTTNLSGVVRYNDAWTPLVLNNTRLGYFLELDNSTTGIAYSKFNTDTSGNFRLNNVPNGQYVLMAYYNKTLVYNSQTLYFTGGIDVGEDVITNRTPTDLITIDSFS